MRRPCIFDGAIILTDENIAGTVLEIMASTSMHAACDELIPRFERTTGCRVNIAYDAAKLWLERIDAGESADLVIFTSGTLDELEALGKFEKERRDLTQHGIGMAVAKGAPHPDISTVEAFKRALLAADSIACTSAGASGMYFAKLIERLGIAAEIRAKARMQPAGLIGELVARGEAQIAIQQIPELMAVEGIEIVGPLPGDLQVISKASAALFKTARNRRAAQAFVEFLTTPEAAQVFKARGFELCAAPAR